jgi:anaerobic magnesium-protoporphyrin IX monomethyl ester cyclase
MKVLFVNPFFFKDSALERRFKTFYFPLGLLYLASAGREAGHRVDVFDGTFVSDESVFEESLSASAPEVVCISSWITVQPAALRLAALASEHGARVVVGGPGPTADPEPYLGAPSVSAVVIGEGERTLVELLEAWETDRPLEEVDGLAWLAASGKLETSPPRTLIHDLDSIPLPARDLIDVERYLAMWKAEHGYSSLTVHASRGCPDENCPFCTTAVMGPNLRLRSHAHIVEEMLHLEKAYPVERFRFVDDLNRLPKEWLVALGEAMIAAGVSVEYEGLNTLTHEGLPMLAQTRDICHERNAWIPTQASHGHAPPTLDRNLVRRRWEDAILLEGERLEDP